MLSLNTTVAAADLYNQQHRILITTANVGDYWEQHRRERQTVHNARPRAREHITMANNLAGEDHDAHAPETHLPTESAAWSKLKTHTQHITAPLTHVCFQCGMVNYPHAADTIVAANVTRKRDCRAYRVFYYYIRKLVRNNW